MILQITDEILNLSPNIKGITLIQFCSNERQLPTLREEIIGNFQPTSLYNHSIAQACLLLGNVSQVSNVAYQPLSL